MKVFFDGPENFKNSSEVLNAVEKVLETKLQEYMVSGEEILVGGKQGIDKWVQNFLYLDHHYDKVLVCVHEGEVYRNEGDWPTYLISRFSFAKEEFMEYVDRAFIVWDQISMDAYVTLLGFIVWDKPVDVLLSTDMDIHTITTVEDVRKLLPPVSEDWIPLHKNLPKHMWRKIVRDFIPSEVMKKHLKQNPVSKESVIDLILAAPVSIKKKAKVCRELSKTDDLLHELLELCIRYTSTEYKPLVACEYNELVDNLFSTHSAELEKAINFLNLQQGEMFWLYHLDYKYDEYELWDETISGKGRLFSSFDEVIAYLQRCLNRQDDHEMFRTVMEKWQVCEDGIMVKTFLYHLINKKIVGVENLEENMQQEGCWRERARGSDYLLDIPIPFKVGDFVTLDCRPYAPLRHGLLITSQTILYKDDRGRWRTEELCKYRHQYGDYNRRLSPIYRIEAYDGELLPGEMLLKHVQCYLNGKEKRGIKMRRDASLWEWDYERLVDVGDVWDKDLIKYMAKHEYRITLEEK